MARKRSMQLSARSSQNADVATIASEPPSAPTSTHGNGLESLQHVEVAAEFVTNGAPRDEDLPRAIPGFEIAGAPSPVSEELARTDDAAFLEPSDILITDRYANDSPNPTQELPSDDVTRNSNPAE